MNPCVRIEDSEKLDYRNNDSPMQGISPPRQWRSAARPSPRPVRGRRLSAQEEQGQCCAHHQYKMTHFNGDNSLEHKQD